MAKKRDTGKVLESKELPVKAQSLEPYGSKKRSRVQYACKPELQNLLDLVNLIPPNQEMKNTPEISRTGSLSNFHRRESPAWLEEERRQMIDFDNYIDSFPTEFQVVVRVAGRTEAISLLDDIRTLPSGVSEDEAPNYWQRRIEIFHQQRRWYEDIRKMRADLYCLVEIGENKEEYIGKELEIVLGVLLVEHARLDIDGRIRRQPNRFAEVLEGVEASRIRACLICKKLFWANRKDKRCCSEEHSSIIRQRQSRVNKKEKGKIYAKFAKLRKQTQQSKISAKEVARHNQEGE